MRIITTIATATVRAISISTLINGKAGNSQNQPYYATLGTERKSEKAQAFRDE